MSTLDTITRLGDDLLPGARAQVQMGPRATWAFSLQPIAGAATRLVVRVRVDYRPSLAAALLRPVVGGLHEVMQRKQLRTLERRVEAGRRRG